MLTKILIGLVFVIVAFVIVVLLRPADFRTARRAVLSASPAEIFPLVNDLHKFQVWNPWAKLDPNISISYDGPGAGVNAASSWVGNANVGEGRMTIVESKPNELVRMRLEFFKPFAGVNTATFTFQPDGPRTHVTWEMTGRQSFIPRAVGLFIDMDKMIGSQFEQGLATLKTLAEGAKK